MSPSPSAVSRARWVAAFAALVLTCAVGAAPARFSFDLGKANAESGVIVLVTLERPRVSSVRGLAPSRTTAVVRVDAVYKGAPKLLVAGRYVTLDFRTPPSGLSRGDTLVVFARTLVISNGVGLSVVAFEKIDPRDATVEPTIRGLLRDAADNALRDRLKSAQAVVLARFAGGVPRGDIVDVTDEHHPQLRGFAIQIKEVLAGTAKTAAIVRFPTTPDIAWNNAATPPVAGGNYIFILRTNEAYQPHSLIHNGITVAVYTLLEANDLLPVSDLQRVRRLLPP